jgi:HNH endonuclease
MSESKFLAIDPKLEDYWRAIILFGKNVACYKFALAKSLLELAPQGKTTITLEELAEPYSRYVVEHIQKCDTQHQRTDRPYPFIEACRQFKAGAIAKDELLEITRNKGFDVVLGAFHNVGSGQVPVSFYYKPRKRKEIIVKDELFKLLETEQFHNLLPEVDARWQLVETAWDLDISRNLLTVNYDSAQQLLFTFGEGKRRVDITSCRDALNGYQKGKCFYSFADISIEAGSKNLTDVDHFFPHSLNEFIPSIDGVWNLVLSSTECNRGEGGKFDRLPDTKYLERLHNRNEFLITSNHPLRETLIQQTGNTEEKRHDFLQSTYNTAQTLSGTGRNDGWKSKFEYPVTF